MPEVKSENPDKKRYIEKIKALFNMTVDRGCTENEAMIAAKQASIMMRKHEISMSDIERENQEWVQNDIEVEAKRKKSKMHWVVMAIGFFTDTKVWYTRTSTGYTYSFFGTKKDTMFAEYLFDMLSATIINELKEYKKSGGYKDKECGHSARASFLAGLTNRLSERLVEMKNAQLAKDFNPEDQWGDEDEEITLTEEAYEDDEQEEDFEELDDEEQDDLDAERDEIESEEDYDDDDEEQEEEVENPYALLHEKKMNLLDEMFAKHKEDALSLKESKQKQRVTDEEAYIDGVETANQVQIDSEIKTKSKHTFLLK